MVYLLTPSPAALSCPVVHKFLLPHPVPGSPLKMLLASTALTLKHERLQETGNASQQKHLQKTKLLSFMDGLSWSRSYVTCLLLFPEQPPNTCNYCQSLPTEKWKSSSLGSLQEHRHHKGCSQHRMATRDLSGPEKVTRERAERGPQIFPFEVCYDARHHIKYSVIISIAGGQFVSALKTWPLS